MISSNIALVGQYCVSQITDYNFSLLLDLIRAAFKIDYNVS